MLHDTVWTPPPLTQRVLLGPVTDTPLLCISQVLAMGVLAAMWGELTHRLGSTSRVQFYLMFLSSLVSVVVGMLWLVLLCTGKLHEILD